MPDKNPHLCRLDEAKAHADKLAKQHGCDIYYVAVPIRDYEPGTRDDDMVFRCAFLKAPDQHVMRSLVPLFPRQQLYDVAEIMLTNCQVDPDPELATDPMYVFAAIPSIEAMLGARMGRMGKSLRPGGTP